MDLLGKLFGGDDKVKVMRLFILNSEVALRIEEVVKRSRITRVSARREIGRLRQIGFIKSRRRGEHRLNPAFPFLNHLRGLFRTDILTRQREITDRFAHGGKIKLLIVAGLFIQSDDSRADLLLVGDKLKRGIIEREVKTLEAEVGRELTYAVFETADFLYRLNAYDKFIRDVLDYPHERIIDRLNLESGYPHG